MKKFLTLIIFFAILLGLNIPQANATGIQVTVDGKPVHFSGNAPYVDKNGRTMIPLRAVADALGCETTWNSDRQSATVEKALAIEGQSVTLSQTFYPNDEDFCYQWVASATVGQKYLDFGLNDMNTRALVKNGSTYLPIRYVAEYFGYTVQWDGTSQTVLIQSGGKPGKGAERFALDEPVSGNMTLNKLCDSVWVSNGYRFSDTNIYIFSSDGTLTVEWANNAIPLQGNYLLQGDTIIAMTFDGERVEYFDFNPGKNILVSRNGRKIVEQDYFDSYGNYIEAKTTVEILEPYRENPYTNNQSEEGLKQSTVPADSDNRNTPRISPYSSVIDYIGLTVNDVAYLLGSDFQYDDYWFLGTAKQIYYTDFPVTLYFNDLDWAGKANGEEKIIMVGCTPDYVGKASNITEITPNIPLQANTVKLTELGYTVSDARNEDEFGDIPVFCIEYAPQIEIYFFWHNHADPTRNPADLVLIWNRSS